MIQFNGNEPFHSGGVLLNRTLLDFWRWSSSDLTSNTLRGILAEYIVARALDLPREARVEWDAFDLQVPSGLKLEVKSAAYLQSWDQKAPSTIRLGIAPTRAWDETASGHSHEVKRQPDVYFFCLLHHQEKATVDPLDMMQWTFYLLKTSVLEERFPAQKSIGLANLLKLKPVQCAYQHLQEGLEKV